MADKNTAEYWKKIVFGDSIVLSFKLIDDLPPAPQVAGSTKQWHTFVKHIQLPIIRLWDMTSEDTNIYPTQIKDKIQNGDQVLVTGKFLNNMVYAETVEKAAS